MGINSKLLFGIIGIAFVGGLFSAVYAGPIFPTITLAGNTHTTGDAQVDGDISIGTSASLDDGFLFFDGGAESLKWEDFSDFFIFSNDLSVGGDLGLLGQLDCSDCVDSDGILDGEVKTNDLADGAVGSLEIADNTITGADIDSTTTITANQFSFASPQTRSVVIFPAEFASTFDVDWLVPLKGAAGVIKSSSTKSFLFASIPQLPDGSTITRLDCRVFDNDAAQNVECSLIRKSFVSNVGEVIGETQTSGASPSNQDISDTSINNPVVDRDTFGYVVKYAVSDETCDESCKLFSAKVTYTIDNVE